MAQHDNGRRAAGHQGEAWQQGHQGQGDYGQGQQEQSSGSRYGSGFQGGQQGGHRDGGYAGGQQDQFDLSRGQQGDNWRESGAQRPLYRPALDDRAQRSSQGGYAGSPADNDFGNRGITESGNFGNYDSRFDAQRQRETGRYGYDNRDDSRDFQRWQGADNDHRSSYRQGYRHGYDARMERDNRFDRGDAGYGWRNDEFRGVRGQGYGQGYAQDRSYNPYEFQGNLDGGRHDSQYGAPYGSRYGSQYASHDGRDHGTQQNWQGGHWQNGDRNQAYHDPDYHLWRQEQMRQLDRDYDDWRQHRFQRFADEFNDWRGSRDRLGGSNASGARNNASARADAQGQGVSEASKASEHASPSTAAKAHAK